MIYLVFLAGVLLGSIAMYVILPIYDDWSLARAVEDSPEVQAFIAAYPDRANK